MTCCLCDGQGTLLARQSADGGDMIEVPCDRCKGSGDEPTEKCQCCGKTDEDLKPHGKLFPENLCPDCWLMAEHGPDDNVLRPEDSHPMEVPPVCQHGEMKPHRVGNWACTGPSGVPWDGKAFLEALGLDPREDERIQEAPPWMEER